MKKSPISRRLITTAAAASVVASGLVGVAAAPGVVGTANAAECKQSSSAKKTLLVDYAFQKSVQPEVGAGNIVKYSLSVSTSGAGNPFVQQVWDYPAQALRSVKPTVKIQAFTLLGGILGGGGVIGNMLEEHVVPEANVKKDGLGWTYSHTGYAVYAGKAFTAEFSYKLPSSVKAGTELTSFGAKFRATPNPPLGTVEFPNMTACTKVRMPNAGEAILGGLDATGLGSAEGQLSSTGSLNDLLPGIIGGVIGGGGEEDKDKDAK